ncbi:MAG: ribonuclease activity regulator RraA [Anaerolineae bacterium]|nr:ribonuclease activity regulator RraA [Anaerolineae bacterium]
MTEIPTFERIDQGLIERLREIGTANIAGTLAKGLTPFNPGKSVAGQAVTLQFMPKREDLHWGDEYAASPERELHRKAIIACEPGDIVVVDARGSLSSGVFGEMMLTSFKARGGQGLVIDGCIRDFPEVQQIDLGLWLRGVTPNFHTQTDIFPHAVNAPIACAGVFVVPGDVIVADDDGAVLVPIALAAEIAQLATEKAAWEVFSRMKLEEGEPLEKYYPLNAEAQEEYEAWLREQSTPPPAPPRSIREG